MDNTNKYRLLVEKLNIYRDAYYNLNNPIVDDKTYDELYDELLTIENETGYILSNSPSQTVGYTVVSELNKVSHSIPLLSLDKTKSVDDIIKYMGDKELICMHKLDGLTVELIYENGKLIQGSTRGNGIEGEDITHNVRMFKNVPTEIDFKGFLRLSGEAIIHINDFNKINDNLTEEEKKRLPKGKYATPRNLVSGSVRQLDNKICASRNVYFYAYNILECDVDIITKYDILSFLGNHGFWVVYQFLKISKKSDVELAIKTLKELAEQDHIPIDGLVFTYNDLKYGESLGKTSHHPLHSIAFKFEDETAETILRDIEWSIGRTGVLTPVAIFDPVELDGTEVSRASLHNVSVLEDLNLSINSTIEVYKANLIIPQVLKHVRWNVDSHEIYFPRKCPECDGVVVFTRDHNSTNIKCTNSNCKGQLLYKIVHFCSKNAMNIDGMSEATIKKFIDKGWVEGCGDLYYLAIYKEQIVKLDGFGIKSYSKLIQSIEKSRTVKLENFIYALGIDNIGRSASKTISKHFNGSFDDFWNAWKNGFDFTVLDDFGETMNESMHQLIKTVWDAIAVKTLSEEMIFTYSTTKSNIDSLFTDKTVVVTGSFENYTRTSIQEKLESLGAKMSSSVSKKTDYLIAGESAGSKLKKAQDLNIKVLSETEFEEIIK